MILRRVIKHVRNQEWTAICIDFFIVVVGVFVGLQVSNWNAARATQQSERSYLVELRGEVITSNLIVEENLGLMNITIASGERSLAFLEQDVTCAADCWRLLVDFFHASQVAARPISLSVFEEMQKLGLPNSAAVKSRMKIYATATGASAMTTQNLPEFRENIRGLIPPSVQRGLWRNCHDTTNGREIYITDCAASITEAEARSILDNIRTHTELHPQLTYWIGANIANLDLLGNQIVFGDAVIAAIDKELEATP